MRISNIFCRSKMQTRRDCDKRVIHSQGNYVCHIALVFTLFLSLALINTTSFAYDDNDQGGFPTGLYEMIVDLPNNAPLVPAIASLYSDGQIQVSFISAAQAFPTQGNSALHWVCNKGKNGVFSCKGRQWRCGLPISATDSPFGPDGKCELRTIPFTYYCIDGKCNTIAGLTCITANSLSAETLLPAEPRPAVCTPFLPVTLTRVKD